MMNCSSSETLFMVSLKQCVVVKHCSVLQWMWCSFLCLLALLICDQCDLCVTVLNHEAGRNDSGCHISYWVKCCLAELLSRLLERLSSLNLSISQSLSFKSTALLSMWEITFCTSPKNSSDLWNTPQTLWKQSYS